MWCIVFSAWYIVYGVLWVYMCIECNSLWLWCIHYTHSLHDVYVYTGASFRNKEEVLALAGCDRLTIAPALLEELRQHPGTVRRALKEDEAAAGYAGNKLDSSEAAFRFQLNEDAMATEKLAEGIRLFSADIRKLEDMVCQMM
ncbi:hypothetical protein EON64_08260 [archaeon]|nr:MAG: hypothetical protein EON64_08260 [archaeon]